METLGPWKILHDHTTGRSEIYHKVDLLTMARHQGSVGLTPQVAAGALFDSEKPTPNEVEKARRRLDKMVSDGYLTLRQGTRGGSATAYFLVVDAKRQGAA
jgi:replicative DNA helicase